MESVLDIVRKTVLAKKMILPGDLVVCGVSGGPDSMCLLHALHFLKDELECHLHVGYLHHHMREQADSDMQMVMEYAGERGIPVTVGHSDVPALAKKMGVGTEEAGREARYRFLFELMNSLGAQKIALGHNLNDQAETVIMRLARGAGTHGLAGIPHVRRPIIRPLIGVKRQDIEEYCRAAGIPTITDVYNLDLRYTRNLVRYKVLPFLTEALNPSLPLTLAKTAEALSWDAEYLENRAEEAFLRHSQREGVVTSVEGEYLVGEATALSTRVVEKAWREAGSQEGNLNIDNIMPVIQGATGVSLPSGVTAVREGPWIRFYPRAVPTYQELIVPGETRISGMGLTISAVVRERCPGEGFEPEVDGCKTGEEVGGLLDFLVEPVATLDYNKCTGPLLVRSRRDGDRFQPLGLNGNQKKLKDFFISRKVPRLFRDLIPIIASGDDIIWVGGMRLSERVKVDANTAVVLELCIRLDLRRRLNCATIC